jgi:hypothetical protein
MQYIGVIVFAVYIALAIFVVLLLSRFVVAHERIASALEKGALQQKPLEATKEPRS